MGGTRRRAAAPQPERWAVTVYARTVKYQGRSDTVDRGITFLRDEAIPAILAMPRCIGMSAISQRSTGLCIVTTAWETREAMNSSVVRIRPIRDKIAKTLESSVEIEEWRVAAMDRRYDAKTAGCVRVTWLRVPRADVEAFVHDFSTVSLPALRAIRGYCSASLLVNPEWGRAAVTVAYESPEASERRLARADGRHQLGTDLIDVKQFDLVMPHLRVPDLASY